MTEQTTEITAYERSVALVKTELTQYKPKQIDTVLGLLQDGNTVPFIARYRKDQTGSLDEVQIREIEERQRYLENFEKRKEEISRLIDEQGKLTQEITAALSKATTLTALEDIYRPYKQKRRTKATIAKEAGLEPFAFWLLMTTKDSVEEKAARLAYSLTKNHPFLDGNKRIGVLIMLVFLEINKIELTCNDDELTDLGLKIAASLKTYEEILEFVNIHKRNI